MNLQDDYLKALELNYNREQYQIRTAKQRFERSAISIQRMFRQYKKRKVIKAVSKIQRWVRSILREIKYKEEQLLYFKEIYYIQKIKAVLVRKVRWRKSLKQFQPRQVNVKPILKRFFLRLKILLRLLRRRLKQNLMLQLRFSIMKSLSLKQFENNQLKFYKQQLDYAMKKDAINKEIQFIENIRQTNLDCFEMHWVSYQQKLVKFLIGRQRADNWVPQQDEYGDRNWINIKTMQTVTEDPVQLEIQENIKRLRADALKKLNQQTQYMTDNINELQMTSESLQPKLTVDLTKIYKSFFQNKDFTLKFRRYLEKK